MRFIKISVLLTIIVSLVLITFNFIMGRTPQQPYQLIARKENIEFRYYPQAVIAHFENNIPGYNRAANENFRVLASYIFGQNDRNEKIPMTAPVHVELKENAVAMSFVMPQGYHLTNLPKPLHPSIELQKTAACYVAAIRFGGWASDRIITDKIQQLHNLLQRWGIKHHNDFKFLGYNAPWQILFRRNEIVVSIDEEELNKITAKK
ncbi:MAG: heme-binding protein [Chitinophagales bacterium]|nr:heme-binding protein [Chitinophagales bacterium]MDW8272720.1 heme-binding protein [Chitinophagales bacterium]